MAYLVFEDGKSFKGDFFASDKSVAGELAYVTDMVGFEEVFTDPKYDGKIVVFTYPMVGNYGIEKKTIKGKYISVKAVVAKEFCNKPSNFAMDMTIKEFLTENKIPAISGVDTRAIVKHIINDKKYHCVIVGETLKVQAVPFEKDYDIAEGKKEIERILKQAKEEN